MKYFSMTTTVLSALLTTTASLLFVSCASMSNKPPPSGAAIIDATPDAKHQEHIDGIQLVSINGEKVKGTRRVIAPGSNTIKTRFSWPQGQVQEVDLRFYATPDTVYFIYYDVYPSYTEFANRTGRVSGQVGKGLAATGESFLLFVGGLFLIPSAAVATIAERVDHSVDQHSQAATHIDLMVISPKSGQGIVRRVRAYPDGRVDAKPWAAWAQMKAP